MAANGISTLATKELRQKAKLDLAAANRAAVGNARSTYDITELPTQYSGNDVIDNPNVGGLVQGRPWIGVPPMGATAFDFFNPPSSGTTWTDSTNNVSATINGQLNYTANYGGGLIFDGQSTYLEINNTNSISALTISMAADFESANGNWNTIYSGGNYPSNNVFAYIPGGATDVIEVGDMGDTIEGVVTNTGLAWWDFVYNGADVTVYQNGVQVASGTMGSPTMGFTQLMLVGQRYGSNGDFLNGTIYRFKCVLSALDSTAITTQYNSIKSTYGLP